MTTEKNTILITGKDLGEKSSRILLEKNIQRAGLDQEYNIVFQQEFTAAKDAIDTLVDLQQLACVVTGLRMLDELDRLNHRGLELISHAKEQDPDLPVITLTTTSSPTIDERVAREAGTDEFITLPFRPNTLREALKKHLNKPAE